jgi:STAS-like domain of unknown function (DUF4325)
MASDPVVVSIAKDFYPYPIGRDDNDGTYNGKKFREQILLPKLQEATSKGVKLIVLLEGMQSFGSSFLEEAFGGLVSKNAVNKRRLLNTLTIDPGWPGNDRYRVAILRYIEKAK